MYTNFFVQKLYEAQRYIALPGDDPTQSPLRCERNVLVENQDVI